MEAWRPRASDADEGLHQPCGEGLEAGGRLEGDEADAIALVLGNRELRAGTDHPLELEVRTTVHPAAFDDARLRALGCRLAEAGVDHWAVQRFRAAGTRSPLPRVEGDPAASLTLRDLPSERFASLVVR